jgi:hypothetical protein
MSTTIDRGRTRAAPLGAPPLGAPPLGLDLACKCRTQMYHSRGEPPSLRTGAGRQRQQREAPRVIKLRIYFPAIP